jgi:hypothetical protein
MEMERKDKSRSVVVNKLLKGTDSPFTRRVADYRLPKKFKDYNFTPLSAEISEVLMEIKKDPAFWEPQKIPGNPPYRNAGKYCDFHKQAGHYIEGCVTLRLLIKEFIKNGKLVRFLGEQRNQPGNNKPQNHRDYQPEISSQGITIPETVLS